MKLILAAAVLVACASIAVAQQEYRCTTPKVWYGHVEQFNPALREERSGRFYYDEDNERIAVHVETREGMNTTVNYMEIFLHKEGVGYQIYNATRECRRLKLDQPFPKIGPYLTDEYDGEFYIGSAAQEKDGVRALVYSGTIPERGSFYGVWIPVDEDTCIPVSESFTRMSEHTSSTTRYYDIRLGIFDPNVFTPPSFCF